MAKRNTDKLITALTDFYNGKEVESFGGAKSQIRHDTTWNKLKRVWNDGHGILVFAVVDKSDSVLLINSMLCSKGEKAVIKAGLKVPFEFVFLGYPDYYNMSMESVRERDKGRIDGETNKLIKIK